MRLAGRQYLAYGALSRHVADGPVDAAQGVAHLQREVAEIRNALKALVDLQSARHDEMETEASVAGGIRAVLTPARLT
jgi:hypothetical protein